MAEKMKVFSFTVTESWHNTYHVRAHDADEADGILNELVNVGSIDTVADNSQSYDREVEPCDSEPEKGERIWSSKDLD